mmetsp:Transcript_53226/g.123922  ORF Transcript_53226/g.123922 Transcript_53226/m.123922 type:complete len:208 (+) Transcript_53226:188-811(+)
MVQQGDTPCALRQFIFPVPLDEDGYPQLHELQEVTHLVHALADPVGALPEVNVHLEVVLAPAKRPRLGDKRGCAVEAIKLRKFFALSNVLNLADDLQLLLKPSLQARLRAIPHEKAQCWVTGIGSSCRLCFRPYAEVQRERAPAALRGAAQRRHLVRHLEVHDEVAGQRPGDRLLLLEDLCTDVAVLTSSGWLRQGLNMRKLVEGCL